MKDWPHYFKTCGLCPSDPWVADPEGDTILEEQEITFAEEPDAVRFWEAGQSGRISLQGRPLTLNWARVPPYDPVLSRKIDDGATRHLQARPRIAAPHRPRISAEAGHLSPRPQR